MSSPHCLIRLSHCPVFACAQCGLRQCSPACARLAGGVVSLIVSAVSARPCSGRLVGNYLLLTLSCFATTTPRPRVLLAGRQVEANLLLLTNCFSVLGRRWEEFVVSFFISRRAPYTGTHPRTVLLLVGRGELPFLVVLTVHIPCRRRFVHFKHSASSCSRPPHSSSPPLR